VYCFDLTQDRGNKPAVVNTVVNPRVPYNARNCLASGRNTVLASEDGFWSV
jgi:hypothetical protein